MPSNRPKCQNCGHPVAKDSTNYCFNCGKLIWLPKEDGQGDWKLLTYLPKPNEVLFEIRTFWGSFRGKGMYFYADKFVLLEHSKPIEEIPYSSIEDVDAIFVSTGGGEGGGVVMKVRITLKGNPKREIEVPYNPISDRLESDLVAWLNVKVVQNMESN